jgi:hypothetical protein
MKFIPRLIYEICVSFITAIKKIFTGFKDHENHEIFLIICGVSAVMSLIYPWLLVVAVLTIFPTLHDRLTIHDGLIEIPKMYVSSRCLRVIV